MVYSDMNVLHRMMQLLLHTLALLLLCFSANAQADYYVGNTIELPTMGSGNADHAAIAVNQFGDTVIVNHTNINATQKGVELNALAPLGVRHSDGFKLFNTRRLGDPNLNIFGVGNDHCTKPDVENLGDGSFLVVWSRHDLSGAQLSRIEFCKVSTRNIFGILLQQPQILTARTGEGLLLDDTSISGDAGFMPDIASNKASGSSKAIVVFAHEQSTYKSLTNTFRDYDLRAKKILWPRTISSPTLGPLVTLETGIPIDNVNTEAYAGGLALPDAVIDDVGALTIVYESYIISPHNWHFGPPEGSIQLRRYAADFSLFDEIEFRGHSTSRHQRRPMIATSDQDATNTVTLGWNDIDDNVSLSHRAQFRAVTFTGNTSGYNNPMAIPWDESFGHKDDLANVAMSKHSKLVMATRTLLNRKALYGTFAQSSKPPVSNEFANNSDQPWRPAMAIMDLPDLRSLNYLCFEGPSTSDPSLDRVSLTIHLLR